MSIAKQIAEQVRRQVWHRIEDQAGALTRWLIQNRIAIQIHQRTGSSLQGLIRHRVKEEINR